MINYRKITQLFGFLTFSLAFLVTPSLVMALQIFPAGVSIGTTFNGTDVVISGEVAGNEEAVVQIVGDKTEAHFKQAGKVGGFLWMTVAHLSLSGAPSAYFVYLPHTLSEWHQKGDKRWSALGLDYSALQKDISIEPEQDDADTIFQDFLKLKNGHDLYQMVEDGVTYTDLENNRRQFKTKVSIPADMPRGVYKVRVLKIKNGTVAGEETAELSVRLQGFPLFISNMAYNRSLLYGILSVLIAIGAGFFMGMVFKDKGGAH